MRICHGFIFGLSLISSAYADCADEVRAIVPIQPVNPDPRRVPREAGEVKTTPAKSEQVPVISRNLDSVDIARALDLQKALVTLGLDPTQAVPPAEELLKIHHSSVLAAVADEKDSKGRVIKKGEYELEQQKFRLGDLRIALETLTRLGFVPARH